MRRFTCSEGGSNKFWEATVEAEVLTVRWGKVGTAGQSKSKPFASTAAAEKELAKLIKEKLGKGYVEAGASDAPPSTAPTTSVTIKIDEGAEWPPQTGIVGPLLRLFDSLMKTAAERRVLTGKIVFPPGGLKKWQAKKIPGGEETVGEFFDRARALAEKGERWLALTVAGDTLEIASWEWLLGSDNGDVTDTLVSALQAAAALQPKGALKQFARYKHGEVGWVTWTFVGKKVVIDENGDEDQTKWEDERVQSALAAVGPGLEAWLGKHPKTHKRIEHATLWGYIDRSGDEIVEPTFSSAYEFSESLAFVTVGWDTRVLGLDGKFLPGVWQYNGGAFRRGLAPVSLKERYGYIDNTGALKIPTKFSKAEPFNGPLAVVNGQRWITPDGELVGDKFTYTSDFAEEHAWVYCDAKFGCVDAQARTVIDFVFADSRAFSEGLAAAKRIGEEKWGYINTAGETVIAPAFDEAHPFSDGRAMVCIDKKYSLIAPSGKKVGLPFDGFSATALAGSSYTSMLLEGMLGVTIDGKVGFLSKGGELAIKPQFLQGYGFYEGFANVSIKKGKDIVWGYVNREGEYIVQPKFQQAQRFSEGRGLVQLNGKFGFIDDKGVLVVEPQYKQAQRQFSGGRAWVQLP